MSASRMRPSSAKRFCRLLMDASLVIDEGESAHAHDTGRAQRRQFRHNATRRARSRMQLADTLQRYLFSHYFYSGLRSATGVIGIGALTYLLLGFAPAVAAGTGALAISITDIASPSRQKPMEMLIPLAVGIVATLLTTLAQGDALGEAVVVLAISFVAALLTAYGRRFLPGSFSVFLLMVLALGTPISHAQYALM